MLCVSVRQPWAYWIVEGWKDIENRTWPIFHRGNLLIHAAKVCTRAEYDSACKFAAKVCGCAKAPDFDTMHRGGIVGMVKIVDCVRQHGSPWADPNSKFKWLLARPYPTPFRSFQGERGLFEVRF